jgi:predicted nucleic acid-binding protein
LILLDTSGLLTALFPGQHHHLQCARTLLESEERLILSPFVLAELDYLVSKLAGVDFELSFLEEVVRGAYELAEFSRGDLDQALSVLHRYRDLELGLADASLVVLSGRLRTRRILTLDERHFRALQAPDGKPFELLPADS